MRTLLGLVPVLLLASPARADGPPPTWVDELQVNAFASFAYTFNFNDPKPANGGNQLRVFDVNHNSYSLDDVELSVRRPATTPCSLGFRVDLDAGAAIPRVIAAAGLEAGDFDLKQGFVSYVAPLGSGLRIDAGKFVTFVGLELIDGTEGYNDEYSRSFLFGYAIPFTHTGIRLTYAFNDQVSALLMVTNGWDDVLDDNSGKTVGAQVRLAPDDGASLAVGVIVGPEQPDDDGNVRTLVDVVGTWAVTDELVAGANFDYGHETGATWVGVAGYLRWDPCPRYALALRAETFDDEDGARTGVTQRLSELTFTPTLKLDDHGHGALRAELRWDHSSRAVFRSGAGGGDSGDGGDGDGGGGGGGDSGGQRRNQVTAALNFVALY